jgi:hypothetical protein
MESTLCYPSLYPLYAYGVWILYNIITGDNETDSNFHVVWSNLVFLYAAVILATTRGYYDISVLLTVLSVVSWAYHDAQVHSKCTTEIWKDADHAITVCMFLLVWMRLYSVQASTAASILCAASTFVVVSRRLNASLVGSFHWYEWTLGIMIIGCALQNVLSVEYCVLFLFAFVCKSQGHLAHSLWHCLCSIILVHVLKKNINF